MVRELLMRCASGCFPFEKLFLAHLLTPTPHVNFKDVLKVLALGAKEVSNCHIYSNMILKAHPFTRFRELKPNHRHIQSRFLISIINCNSTPSQLATSNPVLH